MWPINKLLYVDLDCLDGMDIAVSKNKFIHTSVQSFSIYAIFKLDM